MWLLATRQKDRVLACLNDHHLQEDEDFPGVDRRVLNSMTNWLSHTEDRVRVTGWQRTVAFAQ